MSRPPALPTPIPETDLPEAVGGAAPGPSPDLPAWPAHPAVLQVNTAVWLAEIAARSGRAVDLASVPEADWDAVVGEGIDVVWLLGVWQRSAAGRELVLASPEKLAEIRAALPDWRDHDVQGSPFAIVAYDPDPRLGGWAGLDCARAALARRGVRLMLDWVPNHVAPDCPDLAAQPGAFMAGTHAELEARPADFLEVAGQVFPRGRDPYFPPWPDVVQVNAFSPQLRELACAQLARIAGHADAVRADMAMLMLDDVVTAVWGERAGPPLAQGYWPQVRAAATAVNPAFRFVAEVYWGREPDLMALGFEHCYDKVLLDRLAHDTPGAVRQHLGADPGYQGHLVRFLENHDEARAATVLEPWERRRAMTVVLATLPGMTLWHEGQAEGRRVWLPVFLTRRQPEPVDELSLQFHRRIWALSAQVRRGEWTLLAPPVTGWPEPILAWRWLSPAGSATTVVVNDSPEPASIALGLPSGPARDLLDGTAGASWEPGPQRAEGPPGVTGTVRLGPWGAIILAPTG